MPMSRIICAISEWDFDRCFEFRRRILVVIVHVWPKKCPFSISCNHWFHRFKKASIRETSWSCPHCHQSCFTPRDSSSAALLLCLFLLICMSRSDRRCSLTRPGLASGLVSSAYFTTPILFTRLCSSNYWGFSLLCPIWFRFRLPQHVYFVLLFNSLCHWHCHALIPICVIVVFSLSTNWYWKVKHSVNLEFADNSCKAEYTAIGRLGCGFGAFRWGSDSKTARSQPYGGAMP